MFQSITYIYDIVFISLEIVDLALSYVYLFWLVREDHKVEDCVLK